MAVRRVDLRVAHVALVVEQGLDDLAAARRCKAPVGGEADQQELGAGLGQGLAQVATMGTGRIKVIQRAGDQQVSVGVKVLAELVALVAQVTLNLKLHVLRRIQIRPGSGAVLCRSQGFLLQARAADPA